MPSMQETYVFDGKILVPVPEVDVYGVDGDEALDFTKLGYTKLDAFFPEELCIVWERDPDDFLVEICMNGAHIRTAKVEGFPRLMEFVRLYLHPLVVVQSLGNRTGEKRATRTAA